MRVIHTYNALLPGYEPLEISIDVRMTDVSFQIMRAQRKPAVSVTDFPNWTEAVQACQMFEPNPETGEPTETPLAKPECPLTWEGLATLPHDFQNYITGGMYLRDGLDDYTETVHPKLRGR